jgi:hypothetical protein
MKITNCFADFDSFNFILECSYCTIRTGITKAKSKKCPFNEIEGKRRTIDYKSERYLVFLDHSSKLVDQFISIHIKNKLRNKCVRWIS